MWHTLVYYRILSSVLTVLAARPEVWLFEQAPAEERMKVKLLVQVCRARLLRTDDEEIWKTAQTVRPTCQQSTYADVTWFSQYHLHHQVMLENVDVDTSHAHELCVLTLFDSALIL